MSQKGLTIRVVAFLLLSLCIVAGHVESSEKVDATIQRSGETIESIEKSIQDLKITVLEKEMRDLQQDVKVLTNEVKKGNQLQIYSALLSLSPIPLLFWWIYKEIGAFWRAGDILDRVFVIAWSILVLLLTALALSEANFHFFS